jgi:translocation and assembly module TamA
VRGYDYRSIGVDLTLPDGTSGIVGGRSLIETSAELRTRFGERFGVVAFVDAGYVAQGTGFRRGQRRPPRRRARGALVH